MIALPILLYAEMHYRFKYFASLLKKPEPEILIDAPHRIDPDRTLPIMMLIKDADQFPVHIRSVQITIYREGKKYYSETIAPDQPIFVNTRYWWNIAEIEFRKELESVFGRLSIDVDITYEVFGKIRTIQNNNIRTSSKKPLVVYRSKSSLPTLPGWIAGDTHTHSSYTDDQVEFGSPIQASVALSKAMGLSYFCVTDHSYDLDDAVGNYLVNDPEIPKWHQLQNDVNESNSRQKEFVVIRGEEVSCENSDGRTVHLLLFGSRTFFHGSGDGAEKWFQTQCEHTIPYVLRSKEAGVAAYAGHPTEDVPLLQRLLLGRGEWSKQDVSLPELHGIQILNGENSDAFRNGMDVWKWLLLRGEKKFIAAGNDAHGNFNRFVQIGIPFISIREKESQLFGKMKTVLFASVDENSIVSALSAGRSVITNGPLVVVEVETSRHSIGRIGDTVAGKSWVLKIHAQSSEEFGTFSLIRIIAGTVGKHERVLHVWKAFSSGYELHTLTEWETDPTISYIRAEAFTAGGTGVDREGFCYTNPIWISPE